MATVLSTGLKLILEYWKQIIGALLLLYVLYSIYDWIYQSGYDKADSVWIEKHNKDVKALNEKIEKLEKDSRTEASTLKAEAAELKVKLDLLSASFPDIVAHDSKGEKLKCDGKEVVPYLGPDFTKSWNRLNEEGAMK